MHLETGGWLGWQWHTSVSFRLFHRPDRSTSTSFWYVMMLLKAAHNYETIDVLQQTQIAERPSLAILSGLVLYGRRR
jgi:hypothetical protein